MTRFRKLAPRSALLAALPFAVGACDWFTEFKSQPRIEPWEPTSQLDSDTLHPPRGNPQFSVPVSGSAVAGYQVSYRAIAPTIDSMATLANPTPSSAASLENGRKQYTINCAVCHGLTGAGDGPATKYGMIPFPINNARGQSLSDGYIYGMIRNGRGAMPTYDRIEEADRWDVVNYVRVLQGRAPNTTGGTGYYGVPGENGPAVPGASRTAPTLPAPMWRATTTAATPAAPVQTTPTDSAPGLTARPAAPADSAAPTRRTP